MELYPPQARPPQIAVRDLLPKCRHRPARARSPPRQWNHAAHAQGRFWYTTSAPFRQIPGQTCLWRQHDPRSSYCSSLRLDRARTRSRRPTRARTSAAGWRRSGSVPHHRNAELPASHPTRDPGSRAAGEAIRDLGPRVEPHEIPARSAARLGSHRSGRDDGCGATYAACSVSARRRRSPASRRSR
jgi:hypothetical protein